MIHRRDNERHEDDVESVFEEVVFCRRKQAGNGESSNDRAAEESSQCNDD